MPHLYGGNVFPISVVSSTAQSCKNRIRLGQIKSQLGTPMNCRDPFCQRNKTKAACLPAARIIVALVTCVVALSFSACGKNEKSRGNEPLVVNGAFPMAEPALSNAVIRGDVADIQKNIDSGADLNPKDALDRTPLHIAAFYGRTRIIERLIASGADVNAKDHIGMTPLHAAVISGGRQSVQLLLDRQADLAAQTEAGQTALHLAAATGEPKLTKFLIERGADPQQKDFEGRIPLYYAKKNYHPQTTAVLEQTTVRK